MNIKILTFFITVLLIVTVFNVEGRKTSRGRSSGSSRGSSRRSGSNAQPVPTSFSSPQASAPKPSLFGWQERPAQKTQTSSRKSNPTNTHSYPSSNTGLSGNTQAKQPPVHQENIQRNAAPQAAYPGSQSVQSNNHAGHSYPASNSLSGNLGTGAGYNNQAKPPPVHQESIQRNSDSLNAPAQAGKPGVPSHSYPASNGLSGSSGAVPGYPQGSGLSGSNVGPPSHSANAHNVQGGVNHLTNNMGNNYNHAQGHPPPYSSNGNSYQGAPSPYTSVGNSFHHPPPPPPYSSYGHNYGGYGGHGSYNTGFGAPQMPGYFGNYGGSKGFGGMSRTSSALTGVGIAGAGVGTILTGLALWNLARSTGRSHHTVIYDNRGQPVAVAPDNNSTAAAMDSILGDLVNCTLTISNENVTEVLAIPCAIATSFSPEVDVKSVHENINENDKTKCIVTIVTKTERELTTTIPCSVLLNTAAENNVTEPVISNSTELNNNDTMVPNVNDLQPNQPSALISSSGENVHNLNNMNTELYNCTLKPGETPDPINPCFPISHNLTVIPLQSTEATAL